MKMSLDKLPDLILSRITHLSANDSMQFRSLGSVIMNARFAKCVLVEFVAFIVDVSFAKQILSDNLLMHIQVGASDSEDEADTNEEMRRIEAVADAVNNGRSLPAALPQQAHVQVMLQPGCTRHPCFVSKYDVTSCTYHLHALGVQVCA